MISLKRTYYFHQQYSIALIYYHYSYLTNNYYKYTIPINTNVYQPKKLVNSSLINTSYLNKISQFVNDDKLTDLFQKNNLLFSNFEKNLINLNNNEKKHHKILSVHTGSSYDS